MQRFARFARSLNAVAVAIAIAGCNGVHESMMPTGMQPGLVSRSEIPTHMLPDARRKGLLYASTLAGTLLVYTWPGLRPVGTVSGLGVPFTLCVDAAGDVYVPDFFSHQIYEYAHGGSTPIHTLSDSYGVPGACSSDPTTGNLAVADYSGYGTAPGNVLIFKKARHGPTEYVAADLTQCFFVTYDKAGNLFVNGVGKNGQPDLAELQKGGTAFKHINVGTLIRYAGGLQWDGKYLAEMDGSDDVIYQFAVVGAAAIQMGVTKLDYAGDIDQFWVTDGTKEHPQGDEVAASNYTGYTIEVWKYPAGGYPIKYVTAGYGALEGLTISPDQP
jgi:hypothetical protein